MQAALDCRGAKPVTANQGDGLRFTQIPTIADLDVTVAAHLKGIKRIACFVDSI